MRHAESSAAVSVTTDRSEHERTMVDGHRCLAVRLNVTGDWDLEELAELLSPKSGSEECPSASQRTLAPGRKASGEKGRSSLSMVYLAVLLRHIGRGARPRSLDHALLIDE